MKALEKQLDKAAGKFVTGSRMTMADFVLFSQMQDLKLLRLESGEYPRHGSSAKSNKFTTHLSKSRTFKSEIYPKIDRTTLCRAMQFEKDVLATSDGFSEILREDGVWFQEALPQAQELMK